MSTLSETLARVIAEALGDDLDHAFENKSEWTHNRGEKGGRFRDINEPFKDDYLDAARDVLTTISDAIKTSNREELATELDLILQDELYVDGFNNAFVKVMGIKPAVDRALGHITEFLEP